MRKPTQETFNEIAELSSRASQLAKVAASLATMAHTLQSSTNRLSVELGLCLVNLCLGLDLCPICGKPIIKGEPYTFATLLVGDKKVRSAHRASVRKFSVHKECAEKFAH